MPDFAEMQNGRPVPPFLFWLSRTYKDVRDAFLTDEWLAREAGSGLLGGPVIHLWQHPSAMVLGMKERWLPEIQQAGDSLDAAGMQMMVRTSGGAAVPLDMGVLNVSVVWPAEPGQLALDEDFEWFACWMEWMAAWMTGADPDSFRFDRKEVAGGYCPGAFDLSLNGKKICGLAQRRPLRSRIWHGYMNGSGPGPKRAKTVAAFYRMAGAADLAGKIVPEQNGSLLEACEPSAERGAEWMERIRAGWSRRSKIKALPALPELDSCEWAEWKKETAYRFELGQRVSDAAKDDAK